MNDHPNWKRRAWIALAAFGMLAVSYCLESQAWRRQLSAAQEREQQLKLELDVLRRGGENQVESRKSKVESQEEADRPPSLRTLLPSVDAFLPPDLK